jgi:feruloyl esterase
MLPEHCRLAAVLMPTPDSHIEMEIWLPTKNWNGKFLAVGNGGWAGEISLPAVAAGLSEGYAAASNDTGHKGDNAAFAPGHPEKVTDFGYRSMHEMAVQSKAIIQGFYSKAPSRSYYNGCSTGGWQGLSEAQRYPSDFDAMVVGAPVYRRPHLHASELQQVLEVAKDESRYVPREKIQMIARAVTATCDANDGVLDGLITDPQTCRFEPATLACSASGGNNCLTPGQVKSLERVYSPIFTKSGELVYPGHARGFELGWRMPEPGEGPRESPVNSFQYLGRQDPKWDWKTFDMDADLALVMKNAGHIEATNPNLSEFKARGGKLIMYHGWNDPGPSPLDTIQYYNKVADAMGPNQENWMRLFMMPGMGHCGGGAGPDQANFLGALERWVESGVAPDRITAAKVTNGRVSMTRPICTYPQVAKWKGVGSTNDAENFVCAAP